MSSFTVLLGLFLVLMVDQTASHFGSGPHIADVNILLPPKMTNPVEYRLQGGDGCFKWSWDHHDHLSVVSTKMYGGGGNIHLKISVGAHIHPQNPILHIGSNPNFSIEGLNDQISGRWLTAKGSFISVCPLSGVAEVVGEGTTQVYFETSSLRLRTTVTVLTEDIVLVDAPRETLTNVPLPTKRYNFSEISKGVQYDCRVDSPFVGYSNPWLDLVTGNSSCLFFPYSPDMKPDISVSVNASLRGADHVLGSASALFVGRFSVLEMGKDSMQLNLTRDTNKTIITILGNIDVEIYWHHRDLLLITLIHREGFGIGAFAKYEVKMLEAKRFNDTVVITLPANGQTVEIDVNCDPGKRRKFWHTSPEFRFRLNIAFCFYACLMLYLDRRENGPYIRPEATALFRRHAPAAAPVTPERRSPGGGGGGVNEHSPRTPQPFIDYVKRTIDETPYYRRKPRRRVNPKNTF